MDGKITSEKENTPRKVCDEFDKIINFRVCTELISIVRPGTGLTCGRCAITVG